MLKRHWLRYGPAVVVLFGVCLLLLGAALHNHDYGSHHHRNPATSEVRPAARQVPSKPGVGMNALPHAPAAYEIPDKKKSYVDCPSGDYQRCDLAAQQSMAESTHEMQNATWVTASLTAAGVLLLWLTLLATRGMLREAAKTTKAAELTVVEGEKASEASLKAAVAAIEANELARENFVASGRAWLDFIDVRLPTSINVTAPDGSAALRVSATVANFGKTPATSVAFAFKAIALAGDFDSDELLQGIRHKQVAGRGEKIVFPGAPVSSPSHGIFLSRAEIDAALARRKRSDVPISVFLIINVVYSVFGDAQRRETGFVTRLASKDMNFLERGSYAARFVRSDLPFRPWAT